VLWTLVSLLLLAGLDQLLLRYRSPHRRPWPWPLFTVICAAAWSSWPRALRAPRPRPSQPSPPLPPGQGAPPAASRAHRTAPAPPRQPAPSAPSHICKAETRPLVKEQARVTSSPTTVANCTSPKPLLRFLSSTGAGQGVGGVSGRLSALSEYFTKCFTKTVENLYGGKRYRFKD